MRLFGRAPGAVYRVYGEDEYLGGERHPAGVDGRDDSLGGDPRPAALAANVSQARLASFAGPRPAALLVAATIFAVTAIAAVLVLDATAHHGSRHPTTPSATAGPTEASQGGRAQVARRAPRSSGPSRSPSGPARTNGPMRAGPAAPGVRRGSAGASLRPVAGTGASTISVPATPAAVAPAPSSDRLAESENNALAEFGFER
jgi:hypothetical protein